MRDMTGGGRFSAFVSGLVLATFINMPSPEHLYVDLVLLAMLGVNVWLWHDLSPISKEEDHG